jgi:hypothetical protein
VGKNQFKDISDFAFRNRLKRWVFLLLPSGISVWLFRRLLDHDIERNSLSAAKFLVDAQKLYPSKYFLLLPKFLRFSLRLTQTNLPNTFLRQFVNSVAETRRQPARRASISESIYKSTLSLDHRHSSAHGWKLISLALTGFGFVRAGTVARKYCLEAALREIMDGTASCRTLHLAIKGLLEARRFDEAIDCIESHGAEFDANSTDVLYGDYLALVGKRSQSLTTSKSDTASPKDNIPGELLTDKSVALVATGEIKTFSGEDIDQHDTVARVKFQGFDIMPKSQFSGSRCDLTFYTEDLVDKFVTKSASDPTYIEFLEDVKLIVLKRKSAAKIGDTPAQNMKVWAPTFITTATSGTLFLFDILRHQPKRVKLFGFNYYTERQVYNSALLDFYKKSNAYADIGLPKNWFDLSSHQKASATIASGFIPHDPRSDFLLVKNLYELSGLIDGTPEVLEILNLTADEYDARLEEMLGDW